MNLKCFMSRISAFFASLLFMVVFATESFAAMYLPGQVIEKFNYTSDVTFTAQYTAVVCDAGMYLPEGGAECVACPAGYYCLGGGAPVACPAGRYCLSGTQSANGSGLVAAGYYSTGGAKVQNPQSAEDCVGDDNACGLIDAGYWGAAGATISTGSGKVAAGYYNLGGGTSATPVMRGNGCVNLSTTQCGTVAPGFWGAAGATQYVGSGKVSAGYYSTGGGTSATPSASDCVGKVAIVDSTTGKLTGASDTDNTCGLVAAGYWNNGAGTDAQGGASYGYEGGQIAAGYYSTGGGRNAEPVDDTFCVDSEDCGLIEPGYWGEIGAGTSAGSGQVNAGYFSTMGGTSPTPNGNGNGCVSASAQCGIIAAGYWGEKGATTAQGSGQVAAGYYSNGGGTSATPTAAGNGCLAGRQCGTVNGGFYSTGGATTAEPSGTGNGCLAGNECGKLSAEYYSNGGSTDNGATCVSGKVCGTCNANYRANTETGKTAATQCQASCSAGTRVATVNAACTSPAGGWFSAAHLVNYGQISPVNYCMDGYTSASTSASGHDAATDCVQTIAGKSVDANTINARYIKITSDGSESSPDTHVLEIEAFASNNGTGTNLLSGKGGITGSKLTAATNGDWARKTGEWYAQGSALTWDLGSVQALGSLKFAMYTDGREYQNVAIAVSEDNVTYTTVFATDKLLTQNTTTPTGELVVLSAAPKACAAGTYKASGTVALGSTTTCGTCANWTYSGVGATSCTACPAVESGYEKLDSTGTGWTTYQKCVEIATASPTNCSAGKLQKIPTASGATTWAAATVNANNPLVAKPGYIVSGTACLSEGYTVSFEVNGGTDVADMTCTVESADITLPTPTKTGYTFGGWYQNSGLTGTAVTEIAQGTCTSAYKLYAKWTVIEHKITLNANGGTIVGGSSATPSACTVETADITLPTPTKTGYTFGGWYQNSALTGTAVTKIAKGACLSDYTLYAKWTVNTYTVTLDANGGTGGDTSVTATYGELLPAISTLPSQDGYDFNGYWSAKTGGVQYYNMSGVAIEKWSTDAAGTLYAQWAAKGTCAAGTYYNEETGAVETCPAGSYCAGGTWGNDGNNCAIETCPSDYPNSVAGATEEGQCYKAAPKCWCSHDEAECASKGANSCMYDDVRFQGVTYKSNPDMCVAAPGSSDNTYCEIIKVSCKAGTYYTPTGDIEDGSCVSCATLGDGSFKTSYPSLVKYVADSDTGSTACFKSVDLPCTAPVCPLSGTGVCAYDASHSILGGGYLFYGTDEPLPGSAAAYVCPNASFTCNTGYDKNENADIDPTDGSASAPEDLCTPHVYTFTLDPNGGETAVGKIYEKYSVGWYSNEAATAKITKVAVPVRLGYTFAGYYTKMTALEGAVPVIDAAGNILDEPDVAADTVLYAWWQVNTYTVKYNAAGALGTMDSVVHTCDEPLNLTPNAFTSATNDRQFMGWATEPNAATPEYTDGQKVVNLTQVNNAVVTLYPVWKVCTACAAGKGATCSLTAPVGVCTYTTACADNYENLQNAGKYNPACSAIKYAVNMETNGGEISSDYTMVSQCTVESGVIVLPTAAQISREDYRFEGWYDNVATTGSAISSIPAGGCTTNKTLYAKWVINVEVCQPGMYYNGTSFVTCPKGYYCPGEGKVTMGVAGCRTVCPSGYDDGGTGYSDESQCQISVPQGSYLATAKGTNTTVCPAGKYTSGAVLVSYGDTSSCASCEAGNYCSNGTNRSCATETDGVFASSAANSDNINDCYTVTVAGKYIADNAVKTCVVPYYCPGDIKVSYGNSGGNLSCADLSDDVTWQSGVTASGASTPDKCYVVVADGKYWNGDAFATCKAGTYKTEHNVYYGQKSSCATCPAGYTSEAGASECYLTTTAGKYVATAGKGEVECKAGDFCPGGVKVMASGVGGNTACKTLAGGKYSMSAAGTKSADMCYTESCALATNATTMSGKDYYGASVADTCVATLCKAGFTVVGGACSVCPANNVCNPSKDAGKPYTCSELTGGVYTKSAAQTGTADNCYLTTTAGKYVATAGQGEVECLSGGYCAGGVDVKRTGTGGREACPAGYTMSGTGASEINQCYANCAMYSHATQMAGKDFYGTGVDTCEAVECETGFVLANGTCGSCPANSVCDPNYDGGKPHTCSELTNGKYTLSLENSSSIDACYTITTPGKYVAVAGQGEVACKVGDYCLGGVKVMYTATGGNSACSAFGAGYSSDVGASEETQCYQRCALAANATQMSGRDYYGTEATDTCTVASCVAGYTVAGGVCSVCPADHVCDPAKDNGAPHTCSELTDGVYTKSAMQNGSVDNCYLITTAGKYVATAGQGEVDCLAGGYCAGGTKIMRVGKGGREVCPNGYALSDSGAASAQQCYTSCAMATNAQEMFGRDYYANGVDTCEITLCRPGYTLNGGVCAVCPANNICTPDIERGKPQLCSDLTKGTHKFAPAGSAKISDCYLKCEAYDITYGTAIPVSGTENYPLQCRFDGLSVTKNPCDIVNGTCVERSCNYNYEMIGGKCQACARENALSYKKDGGNCVVESCVSGFHPNGQACEVDTVECSVPNAVAATRVWDASKQAFGECVITECEEGYHLGANTCQADEQVCELEHGIGVREWNHKKNTWGDCIATKCDPGYTNDRSQTNELWKQCGRCNNMYSAGGELAASSYVDGCEIATCMYEGELYTLENNECVLICDTYSDETGSRRWNASRKKCERTCEPGYMSW